MSKLIESVKVYNNLILEGLILNEGIFFGKGAKMRRAAKKHLSAKNELSNIENVRADQKSKYENEIEKYGSNPKYKNILKSIKDNYETTKDSTNRRHEELRDNMGDSERDYETNFSGKYKKIINKLAGDSNFRQKYDFNKKFKTEHDKNLALNLMDKKIGEIEAVKNAPKVEKTEAPKQETVPVKNKPKKPLKINLFTKTKNLGNVFDFKK